MTFFFAKLVPKRPDFPANMTAEEGAVMMEHSAFLAGELAGGRLVVAGPVLAAQGAFGMAVFEVDDRAALDAILARDPAQAIGHYEVSPMASAVARPR